MSETVLVTGGAGYIGSHTALALIAAGHDVVVVDNFVNSKPDALVTVSEMTGHEIVIVEGDARDAKLIEHVLRDNGVTAVIHMAALKAVGESVEMPLEYYGNNLETAISTLEAMRAAEVWKFVFSSSATVYGDPESNPIPEGAGIGATNPYGMTKEMIEVIIRDLAASDDRWKITALRYFNPVGAHESGRISEAPVGRPNNLMPMIMEVATGKRDKVMVFGDDWPTPDGTGVRDYIHIMDLVEGHVSAVEHLESQLGYEVFNLGQGKGVSVIELIRAVEQATGKDIPFEVTDRRTGDIAECVADPSKANSVLGWKTTRTIEQASIDAWNSQQR
ncbi:MAG: UDP-glucose 4-epimerase GalE [Acidimicrobiia bacterium]|nr:UDP-glucose 4-epimerase GalE [Acidimicrobiia bacterium]